MWDTLLFIKHFMSPPDLYMFRMFCRHGQIYFCKDIFMLLTSFSGNVFVLRSSYVKNSTRRWVTLSQSVRRETNFSKNRIWPPPTRYVFILEISAKKKSQSTFYLKFVWSRLLQLFNGYLGSLEKLLMPPYQDIVKIQQNVKKPPSNDLLIFKISPKQLSYIKYH